MLLLLPQTFFAFHENQTMETNKEYVQSTAHSALLLYFAPFKINNMELNLNFECKSERGVDVVKYKYTIGTNDTISNKDLPEFVQGQSLPCPSYGGSTQSLANSANRLFQWP